MSGLPPVVVAAGGLRVFQRGAPRSPAEAGLHVGPVSPVDLPDTPALEARVDDGRVWRRLWQTANRLVVHFVDQAVVAVSAAGLVTFDRPLPEEMEQHLLMDHILPLVLATSGAVVVHGGVISLDGRGVVLVGSSGAGKSTLTAFAWKQGWTVGGDDGAVVAAGPPPTAEPTYPTMRLTPDSLQMLDIDPTPSAPIAGKIRITSHGTDGFRPEPVELRVIAILVPAPPGADATFEAIDGVDAHAELFGSTFHVDLTMPNIAKTVDDLGGIVDATTVGRLTVPRGLAGLSAAERLLASAVVPAPADVGSRQPEP